MLGQATFAPALTPAYGTPRSRTASRIGSIRPRSCNSRTRVLEACRILKAEFGSGFHLHMYTSIPFKAEWAAEFAEAGLDEIRFHFLDLKSEKYADTMAACVESGMLTGVEIPCEPDKSHELMVLLETLRGMPVQFLNLNEFAFTWRRSPVQFWPSPPPRIVVVDRIDQSESRRELAPILNRFEPASMIEGSWRWTRLVRRLTSLTVLMPPESFTPRLSQKVPYFGPSTE